MITITRLEKIIPQPTTSIMSKFFSWVNSQEENRLTWLAVALVTHGCVITPFTVITVMATTQNFALFMTAMAAMTMTLVTNLAALPARITIPSFFLSVIIDLVIVGVSFSTFIMNTR